MSGTKSYDLTTSDGLTKAIVEYAKENPYKCMIFPWFPIVAPLFNKVTDAVSALVEVPEKMLKAQRQTAIDIIKAGKENGATKVRVTLDQKAGIDIGGALDGYSAKFSVGNKGNMTIEVEYI